jgi:hypothetical protein
MIGRYTQIRKSQIKNCNKCQGQITFVKNRNDKWFAVDVVYLPGSREPHYKHSAGAHNNMIPWHRCLPVRDFTGEQLVKQAYRLGSCIARRALIEFRADPNIDQTRLCRIMERNNARIVRRLATLPEASKAWVR